MKLKILQEKLNQVLPQAEKLTGKDATLPILGNILLKAEKNSLNIVATNLETGVSFKILAKTEEDGSIVLPAQMFSGLIGSFPGGSVGIVTDGTSIMVTGEDRKSNLKGLNSDEFPTLPVNTEGEYLTLRGDHFCQALAQVVNFTSISSVKPEITGVLVLFRKEDIKIVATDSFRLGEKTILVPKHNTLSKDYSVILPLRAVREIISIFSDKAKNINIFFTINQVTIESVVDDDQSQPQVQFVARLIEGEFPDYQAIIPTSFMANISFSKKEMLNHLKSAGIFAGKGGEINVRVSQKDGSFVIASQSADLGEYESKMKLDKVTGKDVEITFNYRFLLDGLNSIKDDSCDFDFSSDDGPGLLRSANDPGFIYILMPIKKF